MCNRYTPYPNLYPDQSPSEDWTMEERFRPLTFHGLILRSQLVTLLVRGVCYSESQSVSLSSRAGRLGGTGVGTRALCFREREVALGESCPPASSSGMCSPGFPLPLSASVLVTQSRGVSPSVSLHLVSAQVSWPGSFKYSFYALISRLNELSCVCYQKKYHSSY